MAVAKVNIGWALLQKMGWTEGTGLGAKRDGCVEPVAVKPRRDNLGVGAERREFRDAWWEKAFEEAYGKSADPADDVKLLHACEGRRCRPHGAAKLARLAKQDLSAISRLKDGESQGTRNDNVEIDYSSASVRDAAEARSKHRHKEKRNNASQDKLRDGNLCKYAMKSSDPEPQTEAPHQESKTARKRLRAEKQKRRRMSSKHCPRDTTERPGRRAEASPVDLRVSDGRILKKTRKPHRT